MTGNSWYTVARTSDKECVGRVTFSLGSSELVFDVLIQFGNYSLSIVSASVTTVFAIRIRSYGGFSYVDLRADETIEGSPSVTIQQYLNTLSLLSFALAGSGKQECIVSTDSYTPVIEETYVTIDQVETITARKYFADGLAIGDRDNNYILTYGNDGVYMGNHRILTTVDGDTYVTTGSYNSTSKKIELKHGNTTVAEIDATAFIKDGMVDSVTVEDGYLVITFNTDAGKEPISIPLSGFSDDFVTLTTAQTITGTKKHKSIALLNIPMSAPLSGDMESGKSYLYVGTGAYAEEASGGGGGGGGETLTILRNGTQVATYNGSAPVSANILVPTTVASLSDASDYATKTWVENKGYITSAALSGYVTIATDQTITGAKYFSNALAIPLSAPSSPTSGLSYLYAGSGSYAEEPGGGVADVYPLTITKNGSSWLYYDPGEEAVSVNLSVPTKVSDLTNDTGFITSSALNGYATEQWVLNKGYITSSALNGYVNDFEVTGSGNAVTTGSKSGSKITLTKDNTFVDLTSTQKITGAKKHANVALLNIPTSISSSDIESGKVYLYSGSGEYAEEASGGVADVYPLYLVIGGTTTTYDPASESTTVTFGSAAKKGYTTSITQGSADLPTSDAVYSAIAAAVTSALHYRGMSSTALTDGGTETAIIGGESLVPQAGDVVIYGGFEFLWENSVWNKLGDDSSYALKTIQISAGTGLTGGGDLTASRTLSLSSATQTDIGKGVTAYNSLGNYLPLAGNSTSSYVTGPVYFDAGNNSCVIKNIFYNTTTGWSRDVVRLAVDGTNKFTIGAYGSYIQGGSSNGLEYAYIGCNAYNGLNLRITSDSLKWGSNVIYHAGNLTKSVLTTILDSDGGYYLKLTGGTLTGTLNARDILPSATTTYALGSSSKKWNEVWGAKAHISSLLAIPTSAPSSGDIVSGEAYLYSSTGSYSQTPSGGVADVYPLTITKNGSAWLSYNPGVQAESINLVIPTKVSDLTNDTGFITASSIPSTYAWSAITNTPTTLSGYGITDAKIANGTITLGSNSITPLTSFTETDPVFSASAAAGITSTNISNWNTAYGWGNHASQGYLKSSDHKALTLKVGSTTIGSDYNSLAAKTYTITAQNITDTIGSTTYAPYNANGYVPTTRKVNNKALSSDITLSLDDVADGSTRKLANYLALTGGTMSNTNLVTNLNADLLDGKHASDILTGIETLKVTTESDATFTYRAVPSVAVGDVARVTKVKGKSIVWNQQINPTWLQVTTTSTGVTITNNGDGSWTLTGTNDGTNLNFVAIITSTKFVVGHKYILRGMQRQTSAAKFKLIDMDNGYATDDGSGVVYTATNGTTFQSAFRLRCDSGASAGTGLRLAPQLIDLTIMFGAGNEPSTVAEFEALYSGVFYSYNTGELVSNSASAIETIGFNLWDEEWESGNYNVNTGQKRADATNIRTKNFIPCIPGATYYFKYGSISASSNAVILYYDAGKNYLSWEYAVNTTKQMPTNAHYMALYWVGTTYTNDICINLSDTTKNGTYEPYRKDNLPLNITKLKVDTTNLWDEQWGNYGFDSNGVKTANANQIATENYIPVSPSTAYVFCYGGSTDNILYVYEYTDSKGFLKSTRLTKGATLTTSATTGYIQFALTSAYGNTYNHDIWINTPNKRPPLKLNQLLWIPTFTSFTQRSITITNNNDGTFTLNGTADSSGSITTFRWSGFTVYGGRKYLTVLKRLSGTISVRPYLRLIPTNKGAGTGTYFGATVGTVSSTGEGDPYMAFYVVSGTAFTNYKVMPMLIDLTTMYGAGFEPSTPDEFFELVGDSYIPYNTDREVPYFIYPKGMKGTGTASDEVIGKKAIRRYGCIDLGDCNWSYTSSTWIATELVGLVAERPNGEKPNVICTKYIAATYSELSSIDKCINIIFAGSSAHGRIYIKDSAYTDSTLYFNSIPGTKLYYELATPIEYDLETAVPELIECDVLGTQRRLPEDTASSVQAPFHCDFQYGANPGEIVSDSAYRYLPLAGGTITGTLEAKGELVIPDHAPYQPESNKHYLYVNDNGNYYQS